MKLTIGTTYYNNPRNLTDFVSKNLPYVDELIVVDDGSPDPASNHIEPHPKIKLYRVTKDYGFNSHGCRNLIMKESSNNWVILMDADREFMFIEESYSAIRAAKLKQNVLYRFVAHTNPDGSGAHESVNDYLIHRDHFFSAGGYDEEIIGQRWGDREYFEQLKHFGTEKLLHGVNMMLLRDPSVGLRVNSPNDIRMNPKHELLIKQRIRTPEPSKPTLTFDWERVF